MQFVLDEKTAKKISFIVFSAITFYFLLLNFDRVVMTAKWVGWVFMPVFIGISFAFIINPLVVFFDGSLAEVSKKFEPLRKLSRIFRVISIVLSFAIFFGAITLIMFIIVPEVSATVGIFVSNIQRYVNDIKDWTNYNYIDLNLPEWILKFSEENLKSTVSEFIGFLKNGAGNVVTGAMYMTASFLSVLWNIVFGLIISIYLLDKKEAILRFAKRFVCAFFPDKCSSIIFRVGALSNKTFSNFVTGQLTEAVVIGVFCYFGMLAFAFPYAMSIATIIGFTALIPIFGAWIGAICGALLISIVSPVKAMWFIVFIVVLQQLEGNIIYPKVVGRSIGTPSLLVMLAVWVGGSMFGFPGMLFGVPITSIAYSLTKDCIERRLKIKKIQGAVRKSKV